MIIFIHIHEDDDDAYHDDDDHENNDFFSVLPSWHDNLYGNWQITIFRLVFY